MCNDSGFFIKKLKKEHQPGVFVRRKGNKELSDEEMISTYKKLMEEAGGKSKSYFLVSLAILDSKDKLHVKNFKSPRLMLSQDCSTRIKDFPLRSLQYSPKAGKYFAEMTIKEANEVDKKNIQKQKHFIKKYLK